MPASLITFAHSGVSFLMIAVNSGRIVADRLEAKIVELLAHLRHRQGRDGLVVQLIHDILRRAGRREQAEPRHVHDIGERRAGPASTRWCRGRAPAQYRDAPCT
jgi:hypothetical protein